ncbi:MAG: hypothetical protein U0401_01570 [Anaerolineae bacterium]
MERYARQERLANSRQAWALTRNQSGCLLEGRNKRLASTKKIGVHPPFSILFLTILAE